MTSSAQTKTDVPSLVPIRRALLSVSDKTDLVPFARGLMEFGVEIISTGGTAAALAAAGIKVIGVEQVTGFPEMMDGRVKTLHPSVHGALLGRRDLPSHMQAMRQHKITPIDLVCVNLYPFEQTILQSGITPEQAIEQIDIGGPAVLRSASKNFQSVTVVTSADQYDRVINEMTANGGATTYELRRDFAAAAFTRTAEYDTAISAWMGTRRDEAFPAMLRLSYARVSDLRYGENPHQRAAVYRNPASAEPSVVNAKMLHGKELSFNNLNDGAAALELVQELNEVFPDVAAATIIKHTNPCGAATAPTLTQAFERAYAGDPLAAYGGILAVSQGIDEAAAKAICEGQKFLEVIVAPTLGEAPAYSTAALRLLQERWANVRLLAVSGLRHTGHRKINYKSIPGGMLVQERDMKLANLTEWTHAAGPQPDAIMLNDARFAWTVVKHMKSNAIAICRGGELLGGGLGNVDRVTSCRIAIEKAGDRLKSTDTPLVAASDAFFPFPDGPRLLIDAGVTCIIHPGGSKRDQETIDLCNQRGVTCLITGVRHFRH
jgi:phosphoribosylaminoimidazolecarboxamide formyltransferase / IMP cyclohydrolase